MNVLDGELSCEALDCAFDARGLALCNPGDPRPGCDVDAASAASRTSGCHVHRSEGDRRDLAVDQRPALGLRAVDAGLREAATTRAFLKSPESATFQNGSSPLQDFGRAIRESSFTPTNHPEEPAMTHFANQAAADQSTAAACHDQPATLPRRDRIGAAVASVLVTTMVIGSVVFGMTDMAGDAQRLAVVSTPALRA
jgi:hypothetical protein